MALSIANKANEKKWAHANNDEGLYLTLSERESGSGRVLEDIQQSFQAGKRPLDQNIDQN